MVAAAQAYEQHIQAGGKMMVTLAGAMSTARIGRILSRMIRQGKVHAITCTGANLEEDLFTVLAGNDYEHCPNWRALTADDEKALYDQGLNRVTDTCIPEHVMRHIEAQLLAYWQQAAAAGLSKMPGEFMFEVIQSGALNEHLQLSKEDSWMYAAAEMGIPVYAPGWEDSTTGNMFTAYVMQGKLPDHRCVKTGTEQMQHLAQWYRDNSNRENSAPSPGFFQIGGGIPGDFSICAVPMMIQDLKWADTPFWGYFCQISDAVTSYGGYSGAVPNEKITWGKLEVNTPKFMIQSDATIVAPLIFAYVLGD
jgi:deoxyhypusine synthase